MENVISDLAKYLKTLRQNRNETLHQVSKGTDIDSPLLSKLERGERLPTNEQISKIANYYNISESELKVLVTAERIIKDYGLTNTTYEAINLVKEHITPYLKNEKRNE